MPRKGRIVLADTPHHIVQRGHNRNAVFIEPADYYYYLKTLQEWKTHYGVRVYGYCLMTNHVHLILDPGNHEGSMGQLMKRLAGRQTRYVNALEHRTGSLWEGRYKSSPIETETYLLACSRYVDLNPVRAGIVAHPRDYPWSSYRHKAGVDTLHWLDEDPAYRGLSVYPKVRQRLYASYVASLPPDGEQAFITQAFQRGQLTGSDQFINEVQARVGFRIENRGQGRPVKTKRSNKTSL